MSDFTEIPGIEEQSNYDKFSESASRIFLTYDQEEILRRYPQRHDDDNIYMRFLDRELAIDRKDGHVFYLKEDGSVEKTKEYRADANVTLSVFDMLCRSPFPPKMTGKWVNMSTLASKAGAAPTSFEMFAKSFRRFEGNTEALDAACRKLGGIRRDKGDVSYELPVFTDFYVWFQFWDADEEFPCSVLFLWDSSTPYHLHYETDWYIMGAIMDRLLALAGQ